jgi:hypothetical protein
MNFTFAGCSFTTGVGLPGEKSDINNYCNIVSAQYNASVRNISVPGNSNYDIFMSVLNELVTQHTDKLFVQWSGLNRQRLYPGPNTQLFLSEKNNQGFQYRDISMSRGELQKLARQYHMLNHDYHRLIELTNYCDIITRLGHTYNTQIVFINGILPWTQDIYYSNTADNYAENLSDYSKEILEFDTRDDAELNEIFTQLHNRVRSLDQDQWVNMFISMFQLITDRGTDGDHPGPVSHQLYADFIIRYLDEMT